MPEQFHVYGPVTIEVDGVLLGQSDGQVLISVDEVRPHEPITTDAAGGQPEDFITARAHALVQMTLIEWDDTPMDKVVTGMAASSTVGSPAFAARGKSGAVGMLRRRDGGTVELVVRGSKATSRNGGQILTFPMAFSDPNAPPRDVNIGAKASAKVLSLYALADDSDDIYTYEDVPVP